jgi:hypothetical protein
MNFLKLDDFWRKKFARADNNKSNVDYFIILLSLIQQFHSINVIFLNKRL